MVMHRSLIVSAMLLSAASASTQQYTPPRPGRPTAPVTIPPAGYAPVVTPPAGPPPATTKPVTTVPSTPTTTNLTCANIGLGQQASLNGFVPFATTDAWRTNIANAAVDSNSAALIAQLGSSAMHADFGSGLYNGSSIGIPYINVSAQTPVKINYAAYGGQSDPVPMPIPASAWVEGYPAPSGDRHVLALDRDNCFLFELYNATLQGDGSWNADAGAVWDLLNNTDRPYGWTSADAAGLPVFPGLARYDEVATGVINHALRFTVSNTRAAFVAPATHASSSSTAANRLPMGARLRLKASFDTSGFSTQSRVILTALKNYGMILADNGSNLYLSGAPNDGWNNDDLSTLKKVPASAFEVVALGTVYTASSNLPTGTAPVVSAFAASSGSLTVPAGTSVALAWTATGASSYLVSGVGPVRGNTVTVKPTVTTTFTLYASNHFGRTTKTVTVTVR